MYEILLKNSNGNKLQQKSRYRSNRQHGIKELVLLARGSIFLKDAFPFLPGAKFTEGTGANSNKNTT